MITGHCSVCQQVVLRIRNPSHPDETVEIGSFVAVSLDFDATAKNLNELFPFQLFREVTESLPFISQSFLTISVLSFLELPRLVVSMTTSEQEGRYDWKSLTLRDRPKEYPFVLQNTTSLCMFILNYIKPRSLAYPPGFSPEDEINQS